MTQNNDIKATREDRIAVFRDTLLWVRSDPDLSASIAAARKKTKVYGEHEYPAFDATATKNEKIVVSKGRSFETVMKLAKENPGAKIAVMNFANAFKAGGGVQWGASAQEECLCRCSTLYPLLDRRYLDEYYYDYHKKLNTPKASDALAYVEDVVICKTDEDFPERMPKEDWVKVDVITIAAPDLRDHGNRYADLVDGGSKMNDAELFGYHVRRAIHMLTVAASRGADILVLGAFGCGAFKNDPAVVASAYKTALEVFPKVFDKIEFAVYCSKYEMNNYLEFSKILG